ncbi:MAG: polysaccharide pyruvyl transferase family protein [Candidatus Saccharibacteria bacterium]|nr:polysaccharide pyruvyl transferase family protein [Candidatus Saccharibacteria bacterium]
MAIVGSDQVWNPDYISTYNNLPTKNPNNRIISYAASMGVEELTSKQKDYYRAMLEDYFAISVREQSAKELLQQLTDKKIEVVLDPTLLLDKPEYEALEKRPKDLAEDEKYVLCYILGNRDHEAVIGKFAKGKGYKTIYFSDKRDSNYGVEEFLYLIHHAQLICTDSFHACVFSFIFERPFVAFKRTGKENYMYTRLQNLIDTFRLKNREYNGKEITKQNQACDYSEAKIIIKKEQEKSLNFLRKSLEIKDEK